jgi:hypothetical protein
MLTVTQQVEQFGCVNHRGYIITRGFGLEPRYTAWAGDGDNFWFSGDTADDVAQQIDTAIEEA